MLHVCQQELGLRRSEITYNRRKNFDNEMKYVTTNIGLLTVIKSLFEKFLGYEKREISSPDAPRADGCMVLRLDNEINFRFPFAGAPSRGGGTEQCSIVHIPTTWWNALIQSIDTSAVTNVAVTPAADPRNVIVGRKYIGGSDSELYRCAIRRVLPQMFACRRGEKETCHRGLI